MINKILIIFFLLFFSTKIIKSSEIKNLASINNKTITNFDLTQEIKIIEILENRKVKKIEYKFILQQMIRDKMKKIETENNNVKVSPEIILKEYDSIKNNKIKTGSISQELKNAIIQKIQDNYKWNRLISLKYNRNLAVNLDEINQIMISKKIPENKKDEIVQIEKNKKFNIFSKTHFNKIKKKYLVKNYQWKKLQYYWLIARA